MGVNTPTYCDPALAGLDESAERFCREMGHDDFVSYDIETRDGVHTWWNGSSWSTSGNSAVCYMEDLSCRRVETCYNGLDDDGDGYVDENC